MAKRWIGAFHRACPQPGNHGELLPQQGLEVGPFGHHRGSHFNFWVQVANTLLRLFTHPCAVTTHVFGQALGSTPVFVQLALPFTIQ